METWAIVKDNNVLCHYGVKGMKWNKHLLRKTNPDGSLTIFGKMGKKKREWRHNQAMNDTAHNAQQEAKRKRRQLRAASAQAVNQKAQAKALKSTLEKAKKKGRTAKSAMAAAKNQVDHGIAIINKYSKSGKVAFGYVDAAGMSRGRRKNKSWGFYLGKTAEYTK